MDKVCIIGAGPAGLVAGYQLARSGFNVYIYESTDSIGGMCKTIDLWGQRVDLGSHRFFSQDKMVNNFWNKIINDDYIKIKRKSRILYRNKFFNYPLNPTEAFLKLGFIESLKCFCSLFIEKFRPMNDDSFESWMSKRFGPRLYKTFFKDYSQKLWGISGKELHSDFARQRIRKFSLIESIKAFYFKNINHRTLVDEFKFPTKGTGELYKKLANEITRNSGKIFLNSKVTKIEHTETGLIYVQTNQGQSDLFNTVISTMPLDSLIQIMEGVPDTPLLASRNLAFRNTIIVYLQIQNADLFQDQWLYIQEAHVKTGRISNFRNWGSGLHENQETSILALEYWCNKDDKIWNSADDDLIEMAKKDVLLLKFEKEANIGHGKVIRINKCYPVYRYNYKEILKPIRSFFQKQDQIIPIGRAGSFKYNNQDHSILMGLLAADKISKKKNVNLWDINSDFDTYQED